MSRFRTYDEILSGKVPEDFGIEEIKGSSLTIPGQGSDLAQIIASVSKLPPMDERTFDSGVSEDPDFDRMLVRAEMDSMYPAEVQNLGEQALARQEARKKAEKAEISKDADEVHEEKDAE